MYAIFKVHRSWFSLVNQKETLNERIAQASVSHECGLKYFDWKKSRRLKHVKIFGKSIEKVNYCMSKFILHFIQKFVFQQIHNTLTSADLKYVFLFNLWNGSMKEIEFSSVGCRHSVEDYLHLTSKDLRFAHSFTEEWT